MTWWSLISTSRHNTAKGLHMPIGFNFYLLKFLISLLKFVYRGQRHVSWGRRTVTIEALTCHKGLITSWARWKFDPETTPKKQAQIWGNKITKIWTDIFTVSTCIYIFISCTLSTAKATTIIITITARISVIYKRPTYISSSYLITTCTRML